MKKISIFALPLTFILLTLLSSCEAVAGIFKAGMNVGMFIVIAVIVIIIAVVIGLFRRKS